MNWMNNPRYQRGVQKLMSLDPSRRAIFDTIVADEHFADQEMRTRLQHMDLAAQKLANKRQYKTESDVFDIQKDTGESAKTMGWMNIGLSGLLGLQNMSQKKRQASDLRTIASLYK